MQSNPDVIVLADKLKTKAETVACFRVLREVFDASQIIVVISITTDRKHLKLLPKGCLLIGHTEKKNEAYLIRFCLDRVLTETAIIITEPVGLAKSSLSGLNRSSSAALVELDPSAFGDLVGVTLQDDQITQFSYGLPLKFGGVFSLAKQERLLFSRIVDAPGGDRLFAFEALNEVLETGGALQAYCPTNRRAAKRPAP